MTSSTCTALLNANTSCTVGVVFAPSAAGATLGSLAITDDVGTQTAPLTGTGTTPPTDSLTPASLNFPPQTVNTTSAVQQVTLTNNGDTALTPIQVSISGDFAVNNLCGASLAPHATCAMAVTFSPKSAGSAAGQLTMTDSLSTQTVALQGTGTAPGGTVSLSPASLDFGSEAVGHTSVSKALTLTNNGVSAVQSAAVQVTGDFQIVANACTGPIAAGASCTVQVSFVPMQTGARTGTLTLSSGDLPGPMMVNLAGMGMEFQLVVVGSSTATVVGGKTATYTLQLISAGGAAGTLAVSCTGAPGSASCSATPAPAPLLAGATTTLLVNVTTAGQSAAAVSGHTATRLWPAYLAGLLPVFWGIRRHRRSFGAVLLVCVMLAMAGCGLRVTGGNKTGGGGSGGSGGSGVHRAVTNCRSPRRLRMCSTPSR